MNATHSAVDATTGQRGKPRHDQRDDCRENDRKRDDRRAALEAQRAKLNNGRSLFSLRSRHGFHVVDSTAESEARR
jgi:hypothetical protein